MKSESWQKYLFTAKTKLNKLTTDQVATCAKMLALELGKYRLEYGDFPEEVFQQFVKLEEMTEETKKIFKMGSEVMLDGIQQMVIAEGDKGIKKH